MRNTTSVVLSLAAAAICMCGGCDRDEIRSYSVKKEKSATPSPRVSNVARPRQATNIAWTVPEGWKEVPTTEPMRVATFERGKVQILVSTFPGDVGGMLANINRWRGQIGLTPTTDAELAETVITEMAGGVRVNTTRLAGPNEDMLGAVIETGDGNTWFVKAIASRAEATDIESAFLSFCRSFRINSTDSQPPASGASLPTNHPPVDSSNVAPVAQSAPPSSALLERAKSAKVPESWKTGRDASGVAVIAFDTVEGARVTLTSLRGDGGGALANINRWRGQFGLAPLNDLASQQTRQLTSNALLVELQDEPQTRRMIAVIVTESETTWFFKMTGTTDSVIAQAAAFERFALDSLNESEGR